MAATVHSGGDPKAHLKRISILARHLRTAIGVAGGALMLIFTWLQVRELPIAEFIQRVQVPFVLRATVIVYFFSWLYGTLYDVDLFEETFVAQPEKQRSLTRTDFGLIAVITMAGGVILYYSALGAEKYVAGALSAFVVLNIMLWRYTVWKLSPYAQASILTYNVEEDYCGVEQVNLLAEHIQGRWQWLRFATLIAVVLCLDVLMIVAPLRGTMSRVAHRYYQGIDESTYFALLPDALLILFLVVGEGWMWRSRVVTRYGMDALTELGDRYELRPIQFAVS